MIVRFTSHEDTISSHRSCQFEEKLCYTISQSFFCEKQNESGWKQMKISIYYQTESRSFGYSSNSFSRFSIRLRHRVQNNCAAANYSIWNYDRGQFEQCCYLFNNATCHNPLNSCVYVILTHCRCECLLMVQQQSPLAARLKWAVCITRSDPVRFMFQNVTQKHFYSHQDTEMFGCNKINGNQSMCERGSGLQ